MFFLLKKHMSSSILQNIKLYKLQSSLQANQMQKLLKLKYLEVRVSLSYINSKFTPVLPPPAHNIRKKIRKEMKVISITRHLRDRKDWH